MRDRLIELIVNIENGIFRQRNYFTDMERIEQTADILIAHGVTLAEDNNLGKNPPTIEAEPMKHGRWAHNSDFPDTFICSECAAKYDMWKHEQKFFNYCPNCGCKMDLEGEG